MHAWLFTDDTGNAPGKGTKHSHAFRAFFALCSRLMERKVSVERGSLAHLGINQKLY